MTARSREVMAALGLDGDPAAFQALGAGARLEALKTAADNLTEAGRRRVMRQIEPDFRAQARRNMAAYVDYMDVGFRPAEHHLALIAALEAVERGEVDRLMVLMPPGSAKALALDTPIPTPSGWTTMGDVSVGDRVFDDRGMPCRVTWKSPVWRDRKVYRVTTDCGDTIVADEEHEWLVRLCGKRPVFKIKETRYLARPRSKRAMVRRAAPLHLPEAALPIDPYLLGVWLGDGTSSAGSITSGDQDRVWMRAEIEALGYETRDRSRPMMFGVTGLRGPPVSLGLLNDPEHKTYGQKYIPRAYLRASAVQRFALLQGLIDTDGTVAPFGQVSFCSTNALLASGAAELVRSLGAKAGVSEGRAMLNGLDYGPVWHVRFFMRDAARMPRKRERTKNGTRTPNTYLSVEEFGRADTVCIEVDSPSHMFLCGASMTPTHNSTYASVLFPSWYLGRKPTCSIIAASHTQELTDRFGRRARNLYSSPLHRSVFGCGIASDSSAAARWETERGGEYYATGVGGAITGHRCDLGIIDDPVKSREDADSDRSRERTWAWYVNDFLTRLKPGAAQIVIMTRWHGDDLGGRILEYEGARWRVLKLQMEAVADDLLGRAPGERLWPGWFTPEMVEDAKRDVRVWNALYQQEPYGEDGDYFKRDWFNDVADDQRPVDLAVYGASDYAVTEGGGDYTEHGVFGIDAGSNIYVLDWWRGQTSPDVWIEAECDLIMKHEPLCWFGEAGPIRRSIEPFLMRRMEERKTFCRLEWLPSIHDKPTRCRAFQALAANGKVWMPRLASWKAQLLGDLLRFPAGTHDDAVDVCSLLGRGLSLIQVPTGRDRAPQVNIGGRLADLRSMYGGRAPTPGYNSFPMANTGNRRMR